MPTRWEENIQLAHWVSKQRHDYKLRLDGTSTRLTDERVKLLNDSGFVWEASRWSPYKKPDGKPAASAPGASSKRESGSTEEGPTDRSSTQEVTSETRSEANSDPAVVTSSSASDPTVSATCSPSATLRSAMNNPGPNIAQQGQTTSVNVSDANTMAGAALRLIAAMGQGPLANQILSLLAPGIASPTALVQQPQLQANPAAFGLGGQGGTSSQAGNLFGAPGPPGNVVPVLPQSLAQPGNAESVQQIQALLTAATQARAAGTATHPGMPPPPTGVFHNPGGAAVDMSFQIPQSFPRAVAAALPSQQGVTQQLLDLLMTSAQSPPAQAQPLVFAHTQQPAQVTAARQPLPLNLQAAAPSLSENQVLLMLPVVGAGSFLQVPISLANNIANAPTNNCQGAAPAPTPDVPPQDESRET